MKIICATDFSAQGMRAARVAARLAQRFGDTVVLAHVVEPVTTAYPELVADARVWEKAMREKAAEDLARAAKELGGQGITVEEKIVEGYAAEAVSALGKELGARLIVIGTHGRRAVPRFFLGSVAERTVLAADRPVLVVRDVGDGFDEWAKAQRPLKIVVAVDRSLASHAAIEWVKSFRKTAPCDVTFLNVYWPPEQYSRLGLRGPRDVFDPDAETIKVLERDLWAAIGELPGEGKVSMRVIPNWGPPAEIIALEAKDAGADLVVIGTHQRRGLRRLWLGSTTHGALRAAGLPVLCVPTAAAATPASHEIPRVVTVLAPTDLSDFGNAAVPYAYALLAGGGIVELCHVHERSLPSPIYAYAAAPDGGLSAERRSEIERRLAELVPRDAEARGIRTRVSVIDGGTAAEAILQAASRIGVDALSMGSHGRTGLGKTVLGSVASAVVHGSERPVLVVRKPRD